MQTRFRFVSTIKVVVALSVALATSTALFAVTISIDQAVGQDAITDGTTFAVSGWVYKAQTFDPNDATKVTATNANKVMIYLYYQQTRPDPAHDVVGTQRFLLDSSDGNLSLGSSADASYNGSATANMPDRATTTVNPNPPSCWFLHCEAINNTPAAPGAVVATIEKDLDLVWTTR